MVAYQIYENSRIKGWYIEQNCYEIWEKFFAIFFQIEYKVNAPVAGRLRNFCFSFESNSLINQYKSIALFNIII